MSQREFGLESKRILVVDDNELVRRAVSFMLEGSGARVVRASDALASSPRAGLAGPQRWAYCAEGQPL